MIVLDEQLKDPELRAALAGWYSGAILNITDLRPNTAVKDDGVAELLRSVHEPTFITIDVQGFWRRIEADKRFGIVCVQLPCQRIAELSALLRRLFKAKAFDTRRKRLGRVVLIRPQAILCYANRRQKAERVDWD